MELEKVFELAYYGLCVKIDNAEKHLELYPDSEIMRNRIWQCEVDLKKLETLRKSFAI